MRMRLTWDVGQHDEDEEDVVVEGDVVLVGEPHGEHSGLAHKWQSTIDGHQLTDHSQGIQHDKQVIPADTHTHTESTLTE